jgi:DNA-binding MarR family transcriptional regulator
MTPENAAPDEQQFGPPSIATRNKPTEQVRLGTCGVGWNLTNMKEMEHRMPRFHLPKPLTDAEYVALAEFRYQLRRFLRYTEEQARSRGLHPQQYQLLLAIKGLPKTLTPTIAALAERMQLNHNSIVELVNRCEKSGLLKRSRDDNDRRWVSLSVTEKGNAVLRQQASASRQELLSIGPVLVHTLQRLMTKHSRRSRGQATSKA